MCDLKKKYSKSDDSGSLDDVTHNTDTRKGASATHPELDFDLSSLTDSDTTEVTSDIFLDNDIPYIGKGQANLDSAKSLVVKQNTDLAVSRESRTISRMQDNLLLDVRGSWKRKIIHPAMENQDIINAYRTIRTKLLQKAKGKNLVTMVASLQYGMGTTFSSVNLASAFSYEGQKTSLVIDCDIRKNRLERYFPNQGDNGLTDYLTNSDIGTESIIYQSGVSRMRYIPVGNKKDTAGEVFSSERMHDLVMQLQKRYTDRYIILNAPPVEVSVDAAILSEICDFIVFILPYGKVTNERLTKAIRLLPKNKIVGFVVNNQSSYV